MSQKDLKLQAKLQAKTPSLGHVTARTRDIAQNLILMVSIDCGVHLIFCCPRYAFEQHVWPLAKGVL
jgi:hypothetical protein